MSSEDTRDALSVGRPDQPAAAGNGRSSLVNLLNALANLVGKLTWAAALLVLLSVLGHYVYTSWRRTPPRPPADRTVPAPPTVPWHQVDQAVAKAVQEAARAAEEHADRELSAWVAELQTRIDQDFLPWYFGYFNQQWLGLKAVGCYVADTRPVEYLLGEQPSMAERITEDIQREFANRVLRPPIAQKRIERIAQSTLRTFFQQLEGRLSLVQQQYEVPQPEWDSYLADLAVLAEESEGNRQVALTLKSLVGVGAVGAVATVRTAGMVRAVAEKIGARVTRQTAAEAGEEAVAKLASRTGGKVAARFGGKFLGTFVAVGIIAWDLWDHYQTRKEQEPILRRNLSEYLFELKQDLLHNPECGLVTLVRRMESRIVQQVRQRGRREPTTT